MIEIAVPDANDSEIEVNLDDEVYFLHLAWNSEAEFWTMGIESASHDVLIEGLVLVPDSPLLFRYRTAGLPPGEFLAVATDRRDTVSRAALPAGEVALVYLGLDDILATV